MLRVGWRNLSTGQFRRFRKFRKGTWVPVYVRAKPEWWYLHG